MRAVDQTIGNQGQQIVAFLVLPLRGGGGDHRRRLNDVLRGIQEADGQGILAMLGGGLADDSAYQIVHDRQGAYLLFDQVRTFAAEGGGRLPAQGGTLMGLDFIVGDLQVPPAVVVHGDLAGGDGRVQQVSHQPEGTEARNFDADDPHRQGDGFPMFAPRRRGRSG